MNSFLARDPVVFKQDMAAFEQSPRARAVHEQLVQTPLPWHLAVAMFMGEPQPSGPNSLWLSCKSDKTWALRYLEELYKGDRDVRVMGNGGDLDTDSIKRLTVGGEVTRRELKSKQDISKNTLFLIDGVYNDGMKVQDWAFMKRLCTNARVVVTAGDCLCPDIDEIQGCFLCIGDDEVAQIASLLA
eukprot:5380-Heterococcus_DN1.PRE.2